MINNPNILLLDEEQVKQFTFFIIIACDQNDSVNLPDALTCEESEYFEQTFFIHYGSIP